MELLRSTLCELFISHTFRLTILTPINRARSRFAMSFGHRLNKRFRQSREFNSSSQTMSKATISYTLMQRPFKAFQHLMSCAGLTGCQMGRICSSLLLVKSPVMMRCYSIRLRRSAVSRLVLTSWVLSPSTCGKCVSASIYELACGV